MSPYEAALDLIDVKTGHATSRDATKAVPRKEAIPAKAR